MPPRPGRGDESCQQLFGEISGSGMGRVPLKLLLREAGVKPSAKWVIAEGADGGSHSRSVPLENCSTMPSWRCTRMESACGPRRVIRCACCCRAGRATSIVKWLHRLEVCDAPAYHQG